MIQFATEFPVKPISDKAHFVAQIIAWLRGTNYSTIFEGNSETDFGGETAYLRAESSEELRIRELSTDNSLQAIGFRHDLPDKEGRLWRTEAVLKRSAGPDGQDLVRLRTQCIALVAGAKLGTPRKPFLIKTLLGDGWGGADGSLAVGDQPIWLADNKESLELAKEITLGYASLYLPILYISSINGTKWSLSRDEIEKLAYDLGGVAHIAVEPSRAFSFKLRDQADRSNVYGGVIGLAMPKHGILRRFNLGWRLQDTSELLADIRVAAINLRSLMPATGWDWTELQEQALRRQRERDRNRLTAEEKEELYTQEIINLQDRVKQLEDLIQARPVDTQEYQDDNDLFSETFVKLVGPEIYPGEFSDRLRAAVTIASEYADQIGLDTRSKAVLTQILHKLPLSPALSELREDLRRATKDPKRLAAELTALLSRHGYIEKSDNKHIRLKSQDGFIGLEPITLPKTPSDNRGLKNQRKQIERILGIAKIDNPTK
ncbi:hypothetical protein [Roseibium sp.]|uniref:hypothetical protein n=1 Tax=Roseibium sp. TaxID=1936156 RepID=UPI003A969DA6